MDTVYTGKGKQTGVAGFKGWGGGGQEDAGLKAERQQSDFGSQGG
jgi:hypothetical protein